MKKLDSEKIKAVLTRSVSSIFPSSAAFEKALLSGKKLSIYIGVDATGPHLHLGHLTNFLWMKRMQDLEHEVILLIGDFTAMIGDPTDKMATRQPLTEKQVKQNMRTFKEQVSRIVSFSGRNAAHIRYNSEWYKKMTLAKFIEDLIGYFTAENMIQRDMFTVKQILQRDMFKDRTAQGREIGLKELLYPILQGYDGVAMDVDVEFGGNDQIFNMAIGRALRKAHSKRPGSNMKKGEKFFVATTLLVNPRTGKKLMNKSEGGLINLDDSPKDIFGKVMALDDDSMLAVAEHWTELSLKRIADLRSGIAVSRINPKDVKLEIATAVVEVIYGKEDAKKAREDWESVFSKKELPKKMVSLKVGPGCTPTILVFHSRIAKSHGEARRLVEQGALKINGETFNNPNRILTLNGGEVVKIGKRHFFRIKI